MEENNKLVLAEDIETSENVESNENAATPVSHPIKKLPLTHSLPAKVAAFILTIIAAFLALGSAVLGYFASQSNFYTTSREEIRKNNFEGQVINDATDVVNELYHDSEGGADIARDIIDSRNISYISVVFSEDVVNKTWTYKTDREAGPDTFSFYLYNFDDHFMRRSAEGGIGSKGNAKVNVALTKDFPLNDRYALKNATLNFVYSMRYMTYAVAFASVIIGLSCFIFLMCASGRHQTSDKPEASFGTKIPFDLLVALAGFACCIIYVPLFHMLGDGLISVVAGAGEMVIVLAMFLGLCMSLATRIKLGGWWKNTVTYMILHFIWKCIKAFFKLITKIPLVWKTTVIACGIFFFDLLFVGLADEAEKIIYIFIRSIILLPAIVYVAVMLRNLLNGSKALADGKLDEQVSTGGMILDLKTAANNLNSIGMGMSRAVEERMKSERMKTELITNVSHDIKTPLTSIINYSDLIMKESKDSEKVAEYSEVLHRQSEKLKRLIDDLVETSKATTGNLEVNLAPCSVNEMLSQAEGEYEQKMEAAGLTLISNVPEKTVSIMADGRRLWRVFDNLLNNACKYALSGTRVYMSLEEKEKEAVITFKNTSRDALNISADELMERFVRGDKSRNSGTEGNGLGLAIAKSLTELQNGKMDLFIDGDLFKAELRFPLI